MTTDDLGICVRRVSGGMIVCLGIAVTGMLFARGFDPPPPSGGLILQLGGVLSVAMALLIAANARNRVIAHHLRRMLAGFATRSAAAPPDDTTGDGIGDATVAPAKARTFPAWFALTLGIALTVLFSREEDAFRGMSDSPAREVAVLACTLLWALVLAGVAHGGRVERLQAAILAASLNLEIDSLHVEMVATRMCHCEEVVRLEGKLESQTNASLRLRGDLESIELAHRSTKEELASNRGELASAHADLTTLGDDRARLDGENRRQERLLEKLRGQIKTMESDESALREELERADDQLAKSNIRSEKARRLESELRTKLTRLTARVQMFEDQQPESSSAPPIALNEPAPVEPVAEPRAEPRVEPPASLPGPAPAVIVPPEVEPLQVPTPAASAPASSALRVSSPPPTRASIPAPLSVLSPVADAPGGAAPRLPRLPTELLDCNLGSIVELGRSDLRLECPQAIEGRMTVVLPVSKTKLRVEADVVSCSRISRRKHDVLLRFVDLRPEIAQQILQIGMLHRRRSVLPINSISTD